MAYAEDQELELIKLEGGVPSYYFVKYVRAQNNRHLVRHAREAGGREEEVDADQLRPRQAETPHDVSYLEREVVDVKWQYGAWKVAEVVRRDIDRVRTLTVKLFGSRFESQANFDVVRPHYEYRADGVWDRRGPSIVPPDQEVIEAGPSSPPNTASTGTTTSSSTSSGDDADVPQQKRIRLG